MSVPSSIRYALRSLQKGLGFAAAFVLTLALGLAGVNTMLRVEQRCSASVAIQGCGPSGDRHRGGTIHGKRSSDLHP
jgi:hypothetical protein